MIKPLKIGDIFGLNGIIVSLKLETGIPNTAVKWPAYYIIKMWLG
jgi:hypothetical protein